LQSILKTNRNNSSPGKWAKGVPNLNFAQNVLLDKWIPRIIGISVKISFPVRVWCSFPSSLLGFGWYTFTVVEPVQVCSALLLKNICLAEVEVPLIIQNLGVLLPLVLLGDGLIHYRSS